MGGIKVKPRINIWHCTLLAVIFTLLVLYVFQVNSIVKDRFAQEEMDDHIQELSNENESLQVRLSEAKSLYNLKEMSYEFGLEEVGHISYIEVESESPLVLGN